jgi:hypothetical protein
MLSRRGRVRGNLYRPAGTLTANNESNERTVATFIASGLVSVRPAGPHLELRVTLKSPHKVPPGRWDLHSIVTLACYFGQLRKTTMTPNPMQYQPK